MAIANTPTHKEIRRVDGQFNLVRVKTRDGRDVPISILDLPGAPKVPTSPGEYKKLAKEYKDACRKPEITRREGQRPG